jgi:hypothetical protein
MEYEAEPLKTLHLNFSSTTFGVGVWFDFSGGDNPRLFKLNPIRGIIPPNTTFSADPNYFHFI